MTEGTSQAPKTISIHPALTRAKEMIADAQYEGAAQYLIGFLRQNPYNPQALALLGDTANKLGALGQAEQFLRKAISLGANEYEHRRQLASVLNQQERPAAAMPMFEALAQERGDPTLRGILASMLEKTGQGERARQIYRELVEELPGNPQLWISSGHSLRANGEVEKAVAAYRKAIEVDDGFGDAWWSLASIKSRILTDEDIETMRAALDIAVDERNIAPLNFALARALHDREHYAAAFEHYLIGNDIRAKSLQYDADELSEEIDEIVREVDAQFIAAMPSDFDGDDIPVFIVSMPRSGSTLLEQMIGSHAQVEPVGELPYIPAILRSFMEMATRRGKVTVLQAIKALTPEMAEAFGKDYLSRAALHRNDETRLFIDKLPHNWSNILFIRKILPQARFINIRRPAMDCCFSNFTQSFTSAHASSFTLRDVGRSYVDNVRLLEHLGKAAPGLVHHVDYSALVEDSKGQIGAVLDYLGLDWDDAVLEFHRLERVVRTPSSEQVRRPLNKDGMAIWKPYSEWLDPLRDVLGDLAES